MIHIHPTRHESDLFILLTCSAFLSLFAACLILEMDAGSFARHIIYSVSL